MNHALRNRQTGLTLIELMVALVLGSLLIAGLSGLYLTAHESTRQNQYMNRVAAEARAVTVFFARDVRMAGYQDATQNCTLNGPGMAWANGTLTVRYCAPNDSGSLTPHAAVYAFPTDTSQPGAVRYCQAEGDTCDPASDGSTLVTGFEGITATNNSCGATVCFGEQNGNNGLQYAASLTSFSDLRLVALNFQLSGELTPKQMQSGQYNQPQFHFTVAVRNTNL